MRAILKGVAAVVLAGIGAPVLASGGAHVIDDAAVETPGTCHVETWVTLTSDDATLVNVGPACTRLSWPNVEFGGFIAHSRTPGSDDTLVGLTPKFVFRSEDKGVGIGLATSVGYSVTHGRFETASVVMPLTIPAGRRVRVNLNIGWQWSRATDSHDLFVGGQAEVALTGKLTLMVESFTRDQGNPGGQAGLRWTPDKGNVDLDLIGGRYVDGVTRNAITFGVTVRR
ncbi:MAG: hypothetical protein ABI898_11995 [Sphingomonadales bacterium]